MVGFGLILEVVECAPEGDVVGGAVVKADPIGRVVNLLPLSKCDASTRASHI